MRFSKIFAAALATSASFLATPTTAECDADSSILDLVFCTSGTEGFDHKKRDFDILRELVVTADLVDAVSALDGVTVFAPLDIAFERLAEDLGYDGEYDEGEIVSFLAETLSGLGDLKETLTTVILYHVAPAEYTFEDLLEGMTIETLQGGTIEARPNYNGKRVILGDKEPDIDSPRIHDNIRNIETSQGIVHAITRVLIPLDLP